MSFHEHPTLRLQFGPRKLRTKPLHRNTHAARASLIRAHPKPVLHFRRLILRDVLRRMAQSYDGAHWRRSEHLCWGRGWAVVQFRARVRLVVGDDEASRLSERGRRHKGRLRMVLRGKRCIGVRLCARGRYRAGLGGNRGRVDV